MSPSRREFLQSTAAIAAGAILPASGLLAQVASSPTGSGADRIDVHGHVTPPILIETVGAAALGAFGKWTPEKALAAMDESGVATAMLSDAAALRSRHGG